MRKRIFKLAVCIIYFLSGGILSYFIPVEFRFPLGFMFAYGCSWAWKVIKSETVSKEVNNG